MTKENKDSITFVTGTGPQSAICGGNIKPASAEVPTKSDKDALEKNPTSRVKTSDNVD